MKTSMFATLSTGARFGHPVVFCLAVLLAWAAPAQDVPVFDPARKAFLEMPAALYPLQTYLIQFSERISHENH